jgi:hypothetical protein
MKPKLVYDVLRQTSPRKMQGRSTLPPNRYHLLTRDSSPADSVRSNLSSRSRSISVKRKNSQDGHNREPDDYSLSQSQGSTNPSYAAMCSGHEPSAPAPEPDADPEVLNEEIVKVSSICDKVGSDISKQEIDPALVAIFSGILEALSGICKVQAKLNSRSAQQGTTPSIQVPSVPNKRIRQDLSELVFTDLATLRNRNTHVAPQQGSADSDPGIKRFKDSIKEAEKSVLIFNLNLGRVPIMNQDTMSTRTTMALTEKAAQVEKKQGKIPSETTQEALDDVLSSVKGMKFFGRSTKSYSRAGDSDSGAYCTVPVRYDFADKDARQFAETVLKDKCKVQCSIPCPAILRETMKQVVNEVKKEHPNHFVKVNVDTSSMSLKVSIRPLVDPNSTAAKVWTRLDPIPIPSEALDVSARWPPNGYKIDFKCCKVNTTDVMDVGLDAAPAPSSAPHNSNSSQGKSPRKSREK